MTNRLQKPYVLIQAEDPEAVSRWLCRELFFSPAENGDVRNGNCTLRLIRGAVQAEGILPAGAYRTGLAHVALAANDIREALKSCQARGLSLQTADGESFFNPGVFGRGERYFNIKTPFGFTVEVAMRVGQPCDRGPAPIWGLDHLGVPCADFAQETAALETCGFTSLFAPVLNENPAEGRIRCGMLSDGALTLEVYQFLDQRPTPMESGSPLCGVGGYPGCTTPGGLRFLREGATP